MSNPNPVRPPRDPWSGWKSKLTKAEKRGPRAVLSLVPEFIAFCRVNGWPDWWAKYRRAEMDAIFSLRNGGLDAPPPSDWTL